MLERLRPFTIDRSVGLVLAALVVLATISILMPGLAILFAITIVLLPLAALMAIAPTGLLWFGPSLLAFLASRRFGATLAVGLGVAGLAGAVTAATVAIVPQRANAASEAFAQEFIASAQPRKVRSGPVGVMVLMQDSWPWERGAEGLEQCTWSCERALYSGFAKQYAIGTASDFDPNSAVQRVSIIHELVPIGASCNASMFLGSRAEDGDFPSQTHRRQLFLRDALPGSGLCVRSRRTATVVGDMVMVERREPPGYESYADRDFDWRLSRISRAERLEVFLRSRGSLQIAARHARVQLEPLAQPLRVDLPFNFAVANPGGRAHHFSQDRGASVPVELSAILDARLTVDYLDADRSCRACN